MAFQAWVPGDSLVNLPVIYSMILSVMHKAVKDFLSRTTDRTSSCLGQHRAQEQAMDDSVQRITKKGEGEKLERGKDVHKKMKAKCGGKRRWANGFNNSAAPLR